ncbi:MAG: DUF2809 domain-containing protein [Lachnospiraceae bacterium]|nr:DUF2809 domain-containing protein [Lachnospiraceae bacterium]
MDRKKKRIAYLVATLVFFGIELLIALFVHDKFIRPYVGDILVVVLIYSFVRIFIPEGVRLLPLYIFLFAAGVEVLQYFRIVEVLGLSNNRILSVVIGSVFDGKDIVCYGIGCAILGIFEWTQWCTGKIKEKV